MIVIFKYLHGFLVEDSLDLFCTFQWFGTRTNQREKKGGKDGSSLVRDVRIWEDYFGRQ